MALLLNLEALTPELFLCLSALTLLMLGTFGGPRAAARIAAGGVIALLCVLALVLQSGEERVFFQQMFVSDAFTRFGKAVIVLGSLLAMILSLEWQRRSTLRQKRRGKHENGE